MEVKRGEIWLADLSPTRGTEQIRVIDKARLIKKLGILSSEKVLEVENALREILELK